MLPPSPRRAAPLALYGNGAQATSHIENGLVREIGGQIEQIEAAVVPATLQHKAVRKADGLLTFGERKLGGDFFDQGPIYFGNPRQIEGLPDLPPHGLALQESNGMQ